MDKALLNLRNSLSHTGNSVSIVSRGKTKPIIEIPLGMGILFDYHSFQSILLAEARTDFLAIQMQHKEEHFYSFAFYTCGERFYIYPTASTDEGLEKVAQDYSQTPYGAGLSIDDLKTALRWSPCDSPLHDECQQYLTDSNDFICRYLENPDAELASDLFDEVIFSVLRQLDNEGIFGQGEVRERVVLNLLMGDESHEACIANAAKINLDLSVATLKKELVAGEAIGRRRDKK